MAHPAKELLDSLYSLCDTIDQMPFGISQKRPDFSLRKCLMVEISQFIMYLSASDGRVGWKEASYLSDLLEDNITPSQIEDLIERNNIYSTSFESEVPLTLKLFVRADNKLTELGKSSDSSAAEALVNFFENLGNHFIRCDNDIDANEQKDLEIYLNTMRTYLRKELRTNFHKSTSTSNSLKDRYGKIKKKQ